MKYLMGAFVMMFSSFALAAGPCENYAKAAAIRKYKADSGVIQGSQGIQYWAVQEAGWNNPYLYTVTIADNNEDGEFWEVDYEVTIQENHGRCKTVSVKEVASRD
ncbi:MAG: hypothetical protein OM95_10160 [Bdellovibrio sp. ArHS]|uniref:hypothetical protein n=1 Tax=Bdellovibrio sp. ArHS TaxID=1569284 RepID=UPI000582F948|nr:hypothetical protein [Bdellovibrio sp. ArHS]KHD88131.1 MAG: hypothetical protein OM95_10160 [Bdellovibrio sp. ArHS]